MSVPQIALIRHFPRLKAKVLVYTRARSIIRRAVAAYSYLAAGRQIVISSCECVRGEEPLLFTNIIFTSFGKFFRFSLLLGLKFYFKNSFILSFFFI